MWYQMLLVWEGFELTMLVVIGTDYIGSSKSNYHMIDHDSPQKIFLYIYLNQFLIFSHQ
jgi:hypothetical protein